MKWHWPPRPLGLGTPLNLAALSPEMRTLGLRWWGEALGTGLLTVLLIVTVDALFFGGVTVGKLPPLEDHPPLTSRLLVAVLGAALEELFFRALLATAVAWLVYGVLSRLVDRPRATAQWLGVVAAFALMAWWHTGSPTDATRVLAVNAVAAAAYGWLYWWRGLEAAILGHLVVSLALLIVIPALG